MHKKKKKMPNSIKSLKERVEKLINSRSKKKKKK